MKKLSSISLLVVLLIVLISINDNKGRAAGKTLNMNNKWVRGEDFDESGYNEYTFTLKKSGLLKLNIIRYQQMYTDILDENYNLLFSIGNEGASPSSPSSKEIQEYFDAGTYILKICDCNWNSAYNAYDIKASFNAINTCEKESNTAYTEANKLRINKKYTGIIGVGDVADWFCFTINTTGIYTLNMSTYGSIYYNMYNKNLTSNISHNVWATDGDNNKPGIINTDIKLTKGIYYMQVEPVNHSAKYVFSLKKKTISKPKIKSVKNIRKKQ